jgi:hypothetical protein
MARAPIRRVITGHDDKNVAKVILEGPAANTKTPREGVASTLMWCSDAMPADISIGEVEDMGARILGTAPPLSSWNSLPASYPKCTALRRSITS